MGLGLVRVIGRSPMPNRLGQYFNPFARWKCLFDPIRARVPGRPEGGQVRQSTGNLNRRWYNSGRGRRQWTT